MIGYEVIGLRFSNLEDIHGVASQRHYGVSGTSNGCSKEPLPAMYSNFSEIHQLEKGAAPTIDVDPDDYTSPKTFLNLSLMEIIEGNMDLEETKGEPA